MRRRKKKKNIWKIIPSREPDDQLYNRRLLSYFGLAYSAAWFLLILVLIIIGMVLKSPVDAASITALLGVPAGLAGLGFWKYLQACRHDDHEKEKTNAETDPAIVPDSEGPTDTEIQKKGDS